MRDRVAGHRGGTYVRHGRPMVPDRREPSLAASDAGSWRQPERWVLIRDQGERVGGDAVVPAGNAFGEAEHAARSQCQPDIAGLAGRGSVEGWLSTWAG